MSNSDRFLSLRLRDSLNSRPVTSSLEGTGKSGPLVTVYIVNRDYGRYLAQSIESVLTQDHPGIDIVVVDDASIDESRFVL